MAATDEDDILPLIIAEIEDYGENPKDYYWAIAVDQDGCVSKAIYWPQAMGLFINRQSVWGYGADQVRLVRLYKIGTRDAQGSPGAWKASRCVDSEYEMIDRDIDRKQYLGFATYHELFGYTQTTRAAVLKHLQQEKDSIDRAGRYWTGHIVGEDVIPFEIEEVA